ncbi:Quinolinate synthetase [Acetobacter malorum]|nr:Quinolinate synthetase [Acetobacter malorum]
MKHITLSAIRKSLEQMEVEVTVDPSVADRARLSIERMLAV